MEYGRVRIYSLQQRQTAMSTVKLIFLPHYSRHSGYTAKRVRNTNPDKSARRQKKGGKVRMVNLAMSQIQGSKEVSPSKT